MYARQVNIDAICFNKHDNELYKFLYQINLDSLYIFHPFSGYFCKGNVYICPSKIINSLEYMDYENCILTELAEASWSQRHCNNVSNNNMTAKNYSWVMTDELTNCCYEVCSDESCDSNKVNIGIKNCRDCNDEHCNVGSRFHYWQLFLTSQS